MPPSHIAVLGGGISGLTAAYYLAQRFPNTLISVLEKETRWGGWIQSERVKVSDAQGNRASVLLEAGPRTLRSPTKTRSHSVYALELAHQLGLHKDIIHGPAPHHRYIYNEFDTWDGVPVRRGLARLASSPSDLLRTEVGRAILPSLLTNAVARPGKLRVTRDKVDLDQFGLDIGRIGEAIIHKLLEKSGVADVSVQNYLELRFGSLIADLLGSAFAHGEYATDASELSVATAFPELMRLERLGLGSVVRGMGVQGVLSALRVRDAPERARRALNTGGLLQRLQGTGVFSFRDGLGTLVRTLTATLARNENVRLVPGCELTSVMPPVGDEFNFTLEVASRRKNGAPVPDVNMPPATHVVSALAPATTNALVLAGLRRMLAVVPEEHRPHTAEELMMFKEEDFPRRSVAVVNLVFPPTGEALHPPGLGYAVPRPEGGYEGAGGAAGLLGVSFDSGALAGQDYAQGQAWGSSRFTKMTAMLGGPFPLTRAKVDPERVVAAIEDQMMYYELPKPVLTRVHVHKECLPAYIVGHSLKVEDLHKYYLDMFARLMHIGAGTMGAGIDDCIGVARGAALGAKWD